MALKAKKPLLAKKQLTANKRLTTKTTSVKTINQLKKEADKWFSLATRLRFATYEDGEWWAKCITCSIRKPVKQLQCGHFMSRQYNSTRYSEENCAPQCYGCNVMQQGKQYEFGLAIDLLYGDGAAKDLYRASKVKLQFTPNILMDIIFDSKQQVKYYEEHKW